MTLADGSTWDNGNGELQFASGASGNTLVIDNSAMTNFARFQLAINGDYNTLIITNGGRLQVNGLNFYVSNAGSGGVTGNRAVITGTNSLLDTGGGTSQTHLGVGSGNSMQIDSGGVDTNTSFNVALNSGNVSNCLILTNGGKLYATAADSYVMKSTGNGGWNCFIVDNSYASFSSGTPRNLFICNGSSTGNWASIQNGGVVTNLGALRVVSATGTNAVGNYVSIVSSGKLYTTAACTLFNHAGAVSNYVLVSGPGSLWNAGAQTLSFGLGTGNVLRIEQGGRLDNVGSLTITPTATKPVDFRGGTLGLLSASDNGGFPFAAGDGVQAATLKALGGTLGFSNGLTIATNAMLIGIGKISANTDIVGSWSPGLGVGVLTNSGALTLEAGSTTVIDMNATSGAGTGWDLGVVQGPVSLGGRLNVVLSGGFQPGRSDRFLVMTNTTADAIAGAFRSGRALVYADAAMTRQIGSFAVNMGTHDVVLSEYVDNQPGAVMIVQ
jgi:hypothetical protein